MNYTELIRLIRDWEHRITKPRLQDEKLMDELLTSGLTGFLACDYGSQRSKDAAYLAVEEFGIPFLSLIGGMTGLMQTMQIPQSFARAIKTLNTAPTFAIILLPDQQPRYQSVYPHLTRQVFYPGAQEFLTSLKP